MAGLLRMAAALAAALVLAPMAAGSGDHVEVETREYLLEATETFNVHPEALGFGIIAIDDTGLEVHVAYEFRDSAGNVLESNAVCASAFGVHPAGAATLTVSVALLPSVTECTGLATHGVIVVSWPLAH